MDRLELLLNPVRMRVILTVAQRTLTPQQIAERLPDVAQTTLYRHINLLIEGGVLRVVRESKVRGTIEREVALVEGAGRIDMETAATLTPEQQTELFVTYIAWLLADFQRAQSQPRPGVPPALYTLQRLYMTFDEMQAVNAQLEAILAPYKDSNRDGQPWLFSGIVIPEEDG